MQCENLTQEALTNKQKFIYLVMNVMTGLTRCHCRKVVHQIFLQAKKEDSQYNKHLPAGHCSRFGHQLKRSCPGEVYKHLATEKMLGCTTRLAASKYWFNNITIVTFSIPEQRKHHYTHSPTYNWDFNQISFLILS